MRSPPVKDYQKVSKRTSCGSFKAPERSAMKIRDAVRWNTGASAVYAVGMWTMIGYFGYMKYTGRLDQCPEKAGEEVVEQDDNTAVYTTPHTRTFISYKPDFVPYTTRIYNFFRPPSAERPRAASGGELTGEADEAARRY